MNEEAKRCVEHLRNNAEFQWCSDCYIGDECGDAYKSNCYLLRIANLIESLSTENEILNAAIGQLGAIECHRDMLEHELEQVTRERDAAVRGLARYRRCIDCARYDKEVVTTNTLCDDCSFGSKWQWRGVEANT
jgi:hypothetical protein